MNTFVLARPVLVLNNINMQHMIVKNVFYIIFFIGHEFYRRHYELISKFNVGLKSLLHQGLSEQEFCGGLVYKFKKIRGMTDFSDQF